MPGAGVLAVCAGIAIAVWGGQAAVRGAKKLEHKVVHVLKHEKKETK